MPVPRVNRVEVLEKRGIAKPENIVGPQVRKLHDQQGMTQEMLAAHESMNAQPPRKAACEAHLQISPQPVNFTR